MRSDLLFAGDPVPSLLYALGGESDCRHGALGRVTSEQFVDAVPEAMEVVRAP